MFPKKRFATSCIWQVCLIIIYFLFSKSSAQEVAEEPCELKRSASSIHRSGNPNFWPNGQIPYTLDENLRDEDRHNFYTAIELFHTETCLRFTPKTANDVDHVHMKMISNYPICGSAHLCLQNIGPQIVDIADTCNYVESFVHELCHAACLDHEHVRVDRNEYLDFSQCTDPSKIAKIETGLTSRFYIYDYYSGMHYPCRKACIGFPSKEGVTKCGPDATVLGLSVIDADKLNDLYNCQGCKRHRWVRVDTLTSAQVPYLVNFAIAPGENPVYLCRGFAKGIIAPGTYVVSEKTCYIAAGKTTNKVSQDIQLLAMSNGGPYIIDNMTTSGYHLQSPFVPAGKLVPVGRDLNSEKIYAAVTLFEEDGEKRTLFGYTVGSRRSGGYFAHLFDGAFPISAGDPSTTNPLFYILGCS